MRKTVREDDGWGDDILRDIAKEKLESIGDTSGLIAKGA
jgi:hypothetical protein